MSSEDISNRKLQAIKREVFTLLQKDDTLVDILLREISKEEVAKITRALLDKKAMGSELLGELKQAIDLEKIAVTRLWELLEEDSFEQLVRDLDL